jgi:wyosine [tRNA(Phe)-imidazoG37] synthetase (radical SAM superfamily)
MGYSLLAVLLKDGVTPAYFVDNEKNGEQVEIRGNVFPIKNVVELLNEDKLNLKIIISVAPHYYTEVESQLNEMGLGDCVVSMHVPYCEGILNRLEFYDDSLGFCCEKSSNFHSSRPRFPYFETAQETITNFLNKRAKIKDELDGLKEINSAKPCLNCSCLGSNDVFRDNKIRSVTIACFPSVCQSNCIYCDVFNKPEKASQVITKSKYPDMVAEMIRYLEATEQIAEDCLISIAPAEVTTMLYKDIVFETFANYKSRFLSNGFLFDQKIADSLKRNGSTLNVSLDCGTRETFLTIKTHDMFFKVLENLKLYTTFGNVELKYIVIPGVNDGLDDFLGIVEILKSLCIDTLIIAFDYYLPLRTAIYPISTLIQKLKENGMKFKFHAYYSTAQLEKLIEEYITPQSQAEYERKNNYLREIFYKKYKNDYQAYKEFVRTLELKELSNHLKSGINLSEKDIDNYFFSFKPSETFAERLNYLS